MLNYSRFFLRSIVFLGSAGLAFGAVAQNYPQRTVRIISPTGPSGGADTQARLVAKRFTETMGQPFFVENRPGFSGVIGTDVVVKAPPDGYTLLVTSSLIAVTAAVYRKLPFDALKDLAPVGQIAYAPQLLIVHPSVPAKSVRELVAQAKRQPGRMNAGSSGAGSINRLAIEMLQQATGIKVTQVPYKSGSAAGTALISGEVDFIFAGAVQALPLVRSGRARVLAVTTEKPSPAVPDAPTLDSIYPGFSSANWYGLFAPAGTPDAIIAKLSAEISSATSVPEIREFITREGAEPVGSSPREFAAFLRSEIERYRKVATAADLKVQ
jgi:tripartite-type tricarboxylate transporter receptor subunit TctC